MKKWKKKKKSKEKNIKFLSYLIHKGKRIKKSNLIFFSFISYIYIYIYIVKHFFPSLSYFSQ